MWERGLHIYGATGGDGMVHNANSSRVYNPFAHDCSWATYTQGHDAQGITFIGIMCFQCENGIFESSQRGQHLH
jgi:hypothetical protein